MATGRELLRRGLEGRPWEGEGLREREDSVGDSEKNESSFSQDVSACGLDASVGCRTIAGGGDLTPGGGEEDGDTLLPETVDVEWLRRTRVGERLPGLSTE